MKLVGITVASATTILIINLISFVVAADEAILHHKHHYNGESSSDLAIDSEIDYSSILFNQAMDILSSISDVSSSSASPSSTQPASAFSSPHTILTSSNVPLPLRIKSGPSQIRRFLVKQLQWPKERIRIYLSSLLGPTVHEQLTFEENLQMNKDRVEKQLNDSIGLLEKSADLGSNDALYLLADMYLYGNYTCKRDFQKAARYYEKLADRGNSTAQFMTGLSYSSGLFGTVPVDQAKASLYYTFAAYGGDVRAKMAVGFRHLASIAGPTNFEAAYAFYRSAADKSLEYYLGGDPLSRRHLGHNSFIIPDEFAGGIYGQGASDVSSGDGPLRRNRKNFFGLGSMDGVLELYDEFVSDTSVIVQFALAVLFYEGGIYSEPDYNRSLEHALRGASQVWDIKSGQTLASAKLDKESVYFASRCAGFIGQRYLRGEGVEQNTTKALEWFQRGVEYGDPNSNDGIGLMYLRGIELPKDVELAITHLKSAADKKVTSSQMNLARIYKAKGDKGKEMEYINAAGQGQNLEAIYILADNSIKSKQQKEDMSEENISNSRVYEESVLLLKQLCERVEDFHSPLRWAQRKYKEGDLLSSLVGFLIAAEQGYESAQINVAYILDESPGYIDLTKQLGSESLREIFKNSASTSLVYWTRASKQINVDAQVKMGDYYLKGIGTIASPEKAAACYSAAADRGHGMASWNLGWMHENGIGHENDYHLAKRYYDHALASSPEAYLPVKLSLLQLHIKAYWNTITGGKIRDIIPESKPKLSFREHWDIFWNRWKEAEFKLWDNPEEEYVGDYEWVDVEGDLVETLIIVGIFSIMSVGVWWRQRGQAQRQAEQRQERQEQQQERQEQPREEPQAEQQPQPFGPAPPAPPQQPPPPQSLPRPFGPNLAHPDERPIIVPM